MVKLKKLIFVFDSGRRYELEGDELELFLVVVDSGISLLYTHMKDCEIWKDWNKLMKKIHGGG